MKEIKLTQGKVALVDDEDFEYLSQWKWYASKDDHRFYARTSIRVCETGRQATVRMHRHILSLNNSKFLVDHRDGNGLNNQKSNLRVATPSQNAANKSSIQNGYSKYLGISWHKKIKRWEARISKNNKSHYLGVFKTEIEAAIAYNNAATKLHGEFANLNKI